MSYSPILLFNDVLLDNGDMSGTLVSKSYEVARANTLAIQASWNGIGLNGITTLQVSTNNDVFVTITESPLTVSGNTGSNFYNVQNIGYKYIRLIYTPTAGVGNLNVEISGKSN